MNLRNSLLTEKSPQILLPSSPSLGSDPRRSRAAFERNKDSASDYDYDQENLLRSSYERDIQDDKGRLLRDKKNTSAGSSRKSRRVNSSSRQSIADWWSDVMSMKNGAEQQGFSEGGI